MPFYPLPDGNQLGLSGAFKVIQGLDGPLVDLVGSTVAGSGTETPGRITGGTAGRFVRDNGTVGAWSTATLPNTVARGDTLVASAANVVGAKTVGTVGKIFRADGTDPQWSTATYPDTATAGDLMIATATNQWGVLGIGAAGKLLRSNGTSPTWSTLTLPDTATAGNLVYASASNVLGGLANPGTPGILYHDGTSPSWATTFFTSLTIATTTGSASPTPTTFTIRANTSAADWSTTTPWGELQFYSSDTSGPGSTVRAKVGARMANTAGSLTDLVFYTSNASALNEVGFWGANGSFVIGTAALATNATDGFLYVPTCAGTPTGVPTARTGRSPLVVDTTNSKFYAYIGGAWKSATLV
jgi:hypothetical protein